jgi:hypothetical protein
VTEAYKSNYDELGNIKTHQNLMIDELQTIEDELDRFIKG